jgi:hypothetical protein
MERYGASSPSFHKPTGSSVMMTSLFSFYSKEEEQPACPMDRLISRAQASSLGA